MTRPDPRKGFILVTVLWTIVLLSALVLAASTTSHGFAGIIAVERDRAKAEALLAAGLEASAGIVAGLGDKPLTEREATIRLGTGSVRLNLSDETGRIDVNKAPVEVLSALLRSIGASDDADGIARAIVARRKGAGVKPAPPGAAPSGPPGPNGAAAPQAAPDGKKTGGTQAFTDIRQLAQLPGMTAEYLAALTPLTTVFGADKVNALTAPADVIAALPGISAAQRDALLEARRRLPMADTRLQQIFGQAQSYFTLKARPVAAAELTVRLLDGYTAAVRAVIVRVSDDRQPFRVLAWTPVPHSEFRSAAVSDRL